MRVRVRPVESIDYVPKQKKMPKVEGPIPEITFVKPEDGDSFRPDVSAYLYGVDTCSRGTNTLDSVFDLIRQGRSQLWVYSIAGEIIGAAVSDIIDYPQARACRIWVVGGDVRGMGKTHKATEAYLRAEGCTKMQMDVPLWAMDYLGAEVDMEPVRVIYERELYAEET